MHSNAMQTCRGGNASPRCDDQRRRYRRMQRWCLTGLVGIPLLLGFLWLHFVAARSGDELFYADRVCDCREAASMWARDYIWTQMIWLPGNMLFLLIWIALAVKLWSGRRSPG